jgi:nuclease-like protein
MNGLELKHRSPIKHHLLHRLPGQSVWEERQRLYETRIEEPFAIAGAVLAVGGMEALAGMYGWPRFTEVGAVAAMAALAYMFWIIYRMRPRMRSLALAIDGERAVGQLLEGLRAAGYRVFHDVPGDGFNLDHVVIGPGGVFTIETKTRSFPAAGRPTIEFDGQSVSTAGGKLDSAPIQQARAQASWLSELLHENTSRLYRVQPVVVFPGWYIRKQARARRDVWVLNPRAFPKFLEKVSPRLSEEEIAYASTQLRLYVRNWNVISRSRVRLPSL